MEKRLIDFEQYVEVLSDRLKVDESQRENICREIRQNLYDKYRELLVKGHGLESGIEETIESFEEPEKLAAMFNKLYERESFTSFAVRNKALLVMLSATLLMALLT